MQDSSGLGIDMVYSTRSIQAITPSRMAPSTALTSVRRRVLVLGPGRNPGGRDHPREFGKSIGAIVSAADGKRAGGGEQRRQAPLRNLLPKAGDPFAEPQMPAFARVGFAKRWPSGLQVGQRGARMCSSAEHAPSVRLAAPVQFDGEQQGGKL